MIFQEKEPKTVKRHTLHIRVKEAEREALKMLADKHNMTVSDFVKKAINEYSKQLESKQGE